MIEKQTVELTIKEEVNHQLAKRIETEKIRAEAAIETVEFKMS